MELVSGELRRKNGVNLIGLQQAMLLIHEIPAESEIIQGRLKCEFTILAFLLILTFALAILPFLSGKTPQNWKLTVKLLSGKQIFMTFAEKPKNFI